MTMSAQTKRKNTTNRSRRRNLIAQAMLIIVGVFCLVWLRNLQAANNFPTARLAYTRDGQSYIVTDLQTGQRTEITIPYDSYHPAPDGKQRVRWKDLNICCDSLLLTDSNSFGVYHGTSHSISWTPDSQWIAFSAEPQRDDYYSNRGQDEGISILEEEIYLINVYNLEKKRLTKNAYTDRFPSVSPDGKMIAFTANPDGVERLYLMDIATQNTRLLTPEQDAYKPVWSPDGQWIAFISNCVTGLEEDSTCGDLWLIRADGTNAQSIVLGAGHNEPLWLP